MPTLLRFMAFAFLGFLAAEIHADQWSWLKQDKVDIAVKRLKPGAVILHWCEPCGERLPILGQVRTLDSIHVAPVEDGYQKLFINGDEESVDLAYIYILNKDHRFENVALMAGWPVKSVQRFAVPTHEYERTSDDDPPSEKTLKENAWRLRVLDLAGAWNANQVVTASTCPSAKKGDKRRSDWKFILNMGRLEVLTPGSGQDPAYYEAELAKAGSQLELGTGSAEEDFTADESLEFPLKEDFRGLKGRRIVENRSPACKIEFDVELRKK